MCTIKTTPYNIQFLKLSQNISRRAPRCCMGRWHRNWEVHSCAEVLGCTTWHLTETPKIHEALRLEWFFFFLLLDIIRTNFIIPDCIAFSLGGGASAPKWWHRHFLPVLNVWPYLSSFLALTEICPLLFIYLLSQGFVPFLLLYILLSLRLYVWLAGIWLASGQGGGGALILCSSSLVPPSWA